MEDKKCSSRTKCELVKQWIEKFKTGDLIFYISIILTILFILSPFLVRASFVYSKISSFLEPLGDSTYKVGYIEAFGAILGTFLAITGALWTQRKIDRNKEEKEVRESALIVYYDFKFAFEDIVHFMQAYAYSVGTLRNRISCSEKYKEHKAKNHIYIYIDDSWICNVAKLSRSSLISSKEIEKIYDLYGNLCTVKRAFNSTEVDVSKVDDCKAYAVIYNSCNMELLLNEGSAWEISLKDDICIIMDKLKKIANISNDEG